jgi:hypothetical protein
LLVRIMTMQKLAIITLGFAVSLGLAQDVLAQEPRFSLAVKGGVSAENSEDNLQGTSPALGVTGSVAFAHGWRGEVEFWLPGYIDDANGDPKHRDILFSFSAVKTFRAGNTRPFVVAGLSLTRTEDWFTFCTANRVPGTGGPAGPTLVSCDEPDVIERRRERNDGKDGYLLAGGGVEVPIARRVSVVADVRFSLAPVSVIVRPAVGVMFNF